MCQHHFAKRHANKLAKLLSVSIVTYNPDLSELRSTLDSLVRALEKIEPCLFSLTIVDNSDSDLISTLLRQEYLNMPFFVICGQGNVGFGRGHNLAFHDMGEYHLVLNPDIQMEPNAILNAIQFMNENPQCGLLTPQAHWPNGERQYLCKRYPTIFDLFLRGFAPSAIRAHFKARLDRYEMQTETQMTVYWNPFIVSGCFMFFRSKILEKTAGFKETYFLYFEDFDLSIRTRYFSSIAYVPSVRIVHSGGNSSQKGLWHIKTFILSAVIFFRDHGVKVI